MARNLRNLVVCLDGTRNEPETGATNVARLFTMAVKSDDQLMYYDPGVGTLGARSATTRFGKFLTRVAGLVLGHGVKENIEEAYTFLMRNYRAGDRILVFGFSRGAYTALALTGMIHTVGLLRPGADNLVPYAMKLYANSGADDPSKAAKQMFWKQRRDFTHTFGNPVLPDPFDTEHKQIHFLGVWDAVKSIGWFNWRAQLQQARWPFTRKVTSVGEGRTRCRSTRTAASTPSTASTPRSWPTERASCARCGSPACTVTSAERSTTTTNWPTSR